MEELLFYRAELGAVDAKFIGKKLVLKGDIQLVTLYQGGAGLVPLRFPAGSPPPTPSGSPAPASSGD